jgi:hypothetical protein
MQDESFPKLPEKIALRLASLRSSSITELKQQWRALYNSEPPYRVSCELLTRAVAYRPDDCSFASPTTRARDGR